MSAPTALRPRRRNRKAELLEGLSKNKMLQYLSVLHVALLRRGYQKVCRHNLSRPSQLSSGLVRNAQTNVSPLCVKVDACAATE
jgi:hypothetical protein